MVVEIRGDPTPIKSPFSCACVFVLGSSEKERPSSIGSI